MKTNLKTTLAVLFAFATILIATQPASAYVRYYGGVAVRPVVRPWGFYSPYYYGPYGFYGAYGYSPYGYPYGYYPNRGEVKLDTKVKDAQVFINGSYAGTAGKLKTMWLRPNSYDLEIRAPSGVQYSERIYVVAGKTLHVHPDQSFYQQQ